MEGEKKKGEGKEKEKEKGVSIDLLRYVIVERKGKVRKGNE